MNENKIKLYKKLLAIQKAVAGLGKDTTAFQYKYVGGTKILIHIKPLMNDLGLILKQVGLIYRHIRSVLRLHLPMCG